MLSYRFDPLPSSAFRILAAESKCLIGPRQDQRLHSPKLRFVAKATVRKHFVAESTVQRMVASRLNNLLG